ncbi:hypothetical protein [Bacillus sp. FSL K6-3431]|uniref:hypothetical protein n=1 Tax=Bacillus sp. FSL K6-3431 TaxID=2921500 RepID=UPI0030F91F51
MLITPLCRTRAMEQTDKSNLEGLINSNNKRGADRAELFQEKGMEITIIQKKLVKYNTINKQKNSFSNIYSLFTFVLFS